MGSFAAVPVNATELLFLVMLSTVACTVQLFDMGASGEGPLVKKSELASVHASSDKGERRSAPALLASAST